MDISFRCPEDTYALSQFIHQTSNAKQRDRYRCIELAINGQTTPTIMKMLGRSRGFVQRWCYAYRDHGLDAVKAKSPPGKATRLPPDQHEAFKQRVLAGPTAEDNACTLRGRDFIHILKDEFGVSYQLSGVYELLHRLGLSALKPRPQHRKSDPQAMAQWEERAPFLSATCGKSTPSSKSRSGSRTRRESVSKAH